tara:strand:+ start:458 stop:2944 length:2487 start_codon:yes stop_codon:yes gene_type:complete
MSSFLEVLNPNKNWTIGNGKKHSNTSAAKISAWQQYPDYYLKQIDVVDCSIANTLDVSNAANILGTLDVTRATTLKDILSVLNDATFMTNVDISGQTTITNTLNVSDSTTLNDSLTVKSSTTLEDTLVVTNATTLNNTLYVENKATFHNDIDCSGNLTVDLNTHLKGTLDVTGATTLEETLTVINDTSLNSKLLVGDATTLNSTLYVVGDVSLNSNLTVDSNTHLKGTLEVNLETHLKNTLNVASTTTLNGSLNVHQATTLHNSLDVSNATILKSTLDVCGVTHLYDTLTVDGATTLKSVVVMENDLSLNGHMNIGGHIKGPAIMYIDPAAYGNNTGKVIIEGDLQVNGIQTIINSSQVDISDTNLTLAAALSNASELDVLDGAGIDISNIASFKYYNNYNNGTRTNAWVSDVGLHVQGLTDLHSLNVFGATTLDYTLDVSGATTLNSTLTVVDSVDLNDTLTVDLSAVLNDTLNVKSSTTLEDTLYVQSATTLDSTLYVQGVTTAHGDVSCNSSLKVSDATTLFNTLNVVSDVSLNNTLEVTGATTLHDILYVGGNTELSGNLTVLGTDIKFLGDANWGKNGYVLTYDQAHDGLILKSGGLNAIVESEAINRVTDLASMNFNSSHTVWECTSAGATGLSQSLGTTVTDTSVNLLIYQNKVNGSGQRTPWIQTKYIDLSGIMSKEINVFKETDAKQISVAFKFNYLSSVGFDELLDIQIYRKLVEYGDSSSKVDDSSLDPSMAQYISGTEGVLIVEDLKLGCGNASGGTKGIYCNSFVDTIETGNTSFSYKFQYYLKYRIRNLSLHDFNQGLIDINNSNTNFVSLQLL